MIGRAFSTIAPTASKTGAIHREILNAVLARDADGAAEILRGHVTLIEDFDPEE